MKVQFPEYNPDWGKKPDINAPNQWHRYYGVHIQYMLNILLKGGADVEMVPATDFGICCLLYTSPSPRDRQKSRMPSSA